MVVKDNEGNNDGGGWWSWKNKERDDVGDSESATTTKGIMGCVLHRAGEREQGNNGLWYFGSSMDIGLGMVIL